MKRINALQLRQSLSKVIDTLRRTGEPVLLEKGRKPAAVLISLEDFRTRFVEKAADEKRRALQEKILRLGRKATDSTSAEDILRAYRSGSR